MIAPLPRQGSGCYGPPMLIARTAADLSHLLPGLPARALVPTMGALHDGHLDLVQAARRAGPVVASIFVNPLQFAPGEDLARYPRDEAGDLAALQSAGCRLAFLPDVAEIYPPGDATVIEVAGPALNWEGARRPTHFRGVATVVARLFGLIQPATAWFGEKDWQQLQVIRRMVTDLRLPVAIHGVPTRRSADGLALSSRNRFLSDSERALAPALASACQHAAASLRAGAAIAPTLAAAQDGLTRQGFAVDYFAAVAADSLIPLTALEGPARLIAAAKLGSVRLLDNVAI
jgi:pantoate--beta-alanine ligase